MRSAGDAAGKDEMVQEMTLMVPVSWGELLDKIAILQIKAERIADPARLANVRRELDALTAVRDAAGPLPAETGPAIAELKSVNEALWEVEDALRDLERAQDFGEEFVRLARAVYVTNDRRAALKRTLNRLTGSDLVEEKSYRDYAAATAGG
jgi:hypothetical protein